MNTYGVWMCFLLIYHSENHRNVIWVVFIQWIHIAFTHHNSRNMTVSPSQKWLSFYREVKGKIPRRTKEELRGI